MKIKYAIIAATIIAAATVTSVKAFKESTPLFDANVEALADGEIYIGRFCVYEKLSWCIYMFPYEEYPGVFVTDPVY